MGGGTLSGSLLSGVPLLKREGLWRGWWVWGLDIGTQLRVTQDSESPEPSAAAQQLGGPRGEGEPGGGFRTVVGGIVRGMSLGNIEEEDGQDLAMD